ncbi:hypothetical protein CANARDRAFT_216292 [[Candida] arabinofermentans NRRL YB-2248]|uniref:Peroxisomal ATPase PEX1 n=1 Tax=[Candida] arabinofermentans NRRL YB-2248 TaxID=983967 RepID=A0A1E4T8P3_9ASCO|nr:hypothetical protein CANARDRAFT_216292 [[Candida] arabinofermentans NRRL YB-2248]
MDSIETKVSFKPLNNCLINLPANFINPFLSNNFLVQNIVVELNLKSPTTKKRVKYYCGWNGYFSKDNESIEIDPQFANTIGLKESKKVSIQLIFDLPKIQSVELVPDTSTDWELTELYAQTIEDKFLNQIRCLSLGQQIVVYPNSNSNNLIRFTVKSVKSESSEIERGLLVNDSELHIQPKVFRRERADGGLTHSSLSSSSTLTSQKRRRSVSSRRSSQFDSIPSCLLRGVSLPHTLFDHLDISNVNYEVYANLSQDCFNHQFRSLKYVQVSVVAGPGTPSKSSGLKETSTGNNNNNNQQVNENINGSPQQRPKIDSTSPRSSTSNGTSATITDLSDRPETTNVIARLIHDIKAPMKSIGLSPLLSIALGIEHRVGDLICIEAPPTVPDFNSSTTSNNEPINWTIHPYITTTPIVTEISLKHDDDKKRKELAAKKHLQSKYHDKLIELSILDQQSGCPLTNGMKLPIIPDLLPLGGYLELKSPVKWTIVNFGQLPNIEVGDDVLKPESFIQESESAINETTVVGQDKLILKVIKSLKRGNSSLLYGSSGSGKTVIINEISNRLSKNDGFYIKSINCDTISADHFSNVKNLIEDLIKETSWHSPSLLILESLDAIIPQEMEHGDSGLSKQISEFLVSKFSPVLKSRGISLLCSSKSKDSLNATIFQTHLIEDEYHLKSPDKDLRKVLLSSYITAYDLKIKDQELLNDISIEMEGYLPSDIKILVDRTYHDFVSSSFFNNNNTEKADISTTNTFLTMANFERALQGYVPSSLRGVKLQKSNVAWSDIGGLVEAKQILLETLEWPTKYAPIFANCPLRLRSGILLYGYPGCGKTYLASAIATQCGLNFISIKGPEILNKYIGASEQSIRELFERASSAKPCILFFDEFDSIAPKRGHDSTGVTDRVVNQLLTQMDGAEGLDGVYVLAATSRPDLIDSALLRPGRLDKSILCDLPDFENRLDIIKTVVKKFNIDPECDLSHLAAETDGYSGADLQALIYNSYLKAVHENLDELTKNFNSGNSNKNDKNNVEFFTMFKNSKATEKMEIAKQIETIYKNRIATLSTSSESATDENDTKSMIAIKPNHLIEGLSETKKSISNKELLNFKRIYSTFIDGKREGNMPNGEPSNDIGGRSTLM